MSILSTLSPWGIQPAQVDGGTGGAWSPWAIPQLTTLPKILAPVTVKPLIPNPVPQPIAPWQGGIAIQNQGAPAPTVSVDPVIANAPQLAAAPQSAQDQSGSGGCIVCAASPSQVSASVTAGSTAPAASVSTAAPLNLLSATSDELPWWMLVIAGAAAAWIFRKAGE